MSEVKIFRLMITPRTHIRTVKAERWMFSERVSDEYLKNFGQKKYDERVAAKKKSVGSPNNYLNRKNYVLQYFNYKRALRAEAERVGFVFEEENCWLRFYLPMPRSWSKSKRKEFEWTQHKSRPDLDNLIKSVADSLFVKKERMAEWKEDKRLSDYRATKFWVDLPTGYIEIEVGSLPPAVGYRKWEREDRIK